MAVKSKNTVTYKMLAETMFENYESIYDVNMETNEYKTYYQSDFYSTLKMARRGEDFFAALPGQIDQIIAPRDRAYVNRMLSKENLVKGLEKEKHYRIVYQIQNGEEKIYHQLSATYQMAEDGQHVLMGVTNIDDLIRERIERENEVMAMQQMKNNHLEAVLASAAAFLEANLTRNEVIEKASGRQRNAQKRLRRTPEVMDIPHYDELQRWIGDEMVVENKEQYLKVSSRDYLNEIFQKGDKRATVSFSSLSAAGGVLPCKAVFFLYEEQVTRDLHVFCVIYDLTEEQRKEKELSELEKELSMSRIRNSTSQMQPHFLYNALGSIQELMLIDPLYASDLLGDFMVHLRSCVRAMSSDDPIPFAEELENIKAYTNIEQMRMGKKLEIEYETKETDFDVLPLSIQPLVENAIRHGIYRRGKRGGKVIVRTYSDTDAWVVQVEDNGVGFNVGKVTSDVKAGKKDSTGLMNIRFRLEKVLGGSMKIDSREGKGTIITIRIPKKKGAVQR